MISFSNILYLSEAGPAQASSMERAVTMAQNHQAKLTVMDFVPVMATAIGMPEPGFELEDVHKLVVENRLKEIKALVEPHRDQIDIQTDVLVGNKRFIQVIWAILRNNFDLVIKPVENPGFVARLFGSDDMQLLRNCPCPIWLTRAGEKPKYENILAAVDFDLYIPDNVDLDLNRKILDVSSSLAIADFSTMHLAHIWDGPAESSIRLWSNNPKQASDAYLNSVQAQHEAAFSEIQAQLKVRLGEEAFDHLAPKFHLRRGTAATEIPKLASLIQADLVVMGTVARTGIAGLLIGNTAEAVLEQLQCSVLAVKPSGFVSPVTLP